jgi:heme/copper-type cytochrome/quinol oxidase subunit 2
LETKGTREGWLEIVFRAGQDPQRVVVLIIIIIIVIIIIIIIIIIMNNFTVFKSRKMRWAGHIACMGEVCIKVF